MTHLNHLVASTKSLLKYLAVMVALASSMAPQIAAAIPTVSIGNGPNVENGSLISYWNAQYLTDNLVYTNIPITASNNIDIVDNVDLSTSDFGTPAYDLILTAPVLNLNNNMNRSPFGGLFLNVNTINMAADITSGGGLIDPSRVFDTATQINVLNNAANLQQAIDLASRTAPSTINAQFGNATSLAFNADNHMILSGGLLSGTVAMNSVNSSLVLHGHDFQLNTGGGFAGIGTGLIGATSGQLNGFLDSGNPFAVSFTQGTSGQISLVSSSVSAVPELGTVWLLGSGLIGLVAWQRKRLSKTV